jgi:hypothetical protein
LSEGIARAYLDGEGPFPERLPWLILCGQFLEEFEIMVANWTEWATKVVTSWPDDIRQAPPALDVLEAQARRAERRRPSPATRTDSPSR